MDSPETEVSSEIASSEGTVPKLVSENCKTLSGMLLNGEIILRCCMLAYERNGNRTFVSADAMAIMYEAPQNELYPGSLVVIANVAKFSAATTAHATCRLGSEQYKLMDHRVADWLSVFLLQRWQKPATDFFELVVERSSCSKYEPLDSDSKEVFLALCHFSDVNGLHLKVHAADTLLYRCAERLNDKLTALTGREPRTLKHKLLVTKE